MPHALVNSQRQGKTDPEGKVQRQQVTSALHPADPNRPRTKKPFGLNVLGNNRGGVSFRELGDCLDSGPD